MYVRVPYRLTYVCASSVGLARGGVMHAPTTISQFIWHTINATFTTFSNAAYLSLLFVSLSGVFHREPLCTAMLSSSLSSFVLVFRTICERTYGTLFILFWLDFFFVAFYFDFLEIRSGRKIIVCFIVRKIHNMRDMLVLVYIQCSQNALPLIYFLSKLKLKHFSFFCFIFDFFFVRSRLGFNKFFSYTYRLWFCVCVYLFIIWNRQQPIGAINMSLKTHKYILWTIIYVCLWKLKKRI